MRDEHSPYGPIEYYAVMQIKAYQSPNLISVYRDQIVITPDTTVAVSGNYEAQNLIRNL